jgi:hypothetical protein
MKKTILSCVCALLITQVCSCCRKEESSLAVEIWGGQGFSLAGDGYPLSVIWLTGPRGIPHKGFCQAKEIKEIIQRVQFPEVNEPQPMRPPEKYPNNLLCLFYYKGGAFVSRVAVVCFDIDQNGVFVGPLGKSPALGKLLREKEESGLSRYALYGVPNGPITEEMIDRNIEAAKKLQEEIQRQKEAQAHEESTDKPD